MSEIFMTLPTRISDVFSHWAEQTPDRPALVEAGCTWTYRELASVVAATASWLRESGVRPGDRVMIVCENCRAFVAILFALSQLDAWAVLVNARLSAGEVDKIRDHCGARRVIYTTSVSSHALAHAKRHGANVSVRAGLGAIGISALNESAQPEPVEQDVTNRVAALIYTSGTTGKPKGVMLTHRNLLFVAATSARIRSLTPDDRFYGVLPMFHAVGLSVVLLGTLLSGATLDLAARFDPVAAFGAIETERLTVMLGAPAMYALFLEYAKLKGIARLNTRELRIIASASAPLQLELKSAVEELFGMVLHNGYGVTECSPTIAQTRPEAARKDTSIGPALPGVEVRLAGIDQRPVSDGDVGELWVRGPNVMKGYYHAPEETAAAFNSEGWYNTRDLARMEDGNLFIAGRTKELIVRFGFNVYPSEVEAVLDTHPAVVRSAVVGRTSQGVDGNEEIVAFVQPLPDSDVTPNDLVEYAALHLAVYRRPSEIVFLPTMPLTPTGKVAKSELMRNREST